jgi:hypothetical protein
MRWPRLRFFWNCISPFYKRFMTGYTILGFVRFTRDEILPPKWKGYRILSLLPDWSSQTWLLIFVILLAIVLLEGAFTNNRAQEKALRERHPVQLPSGEPYAGLIERSGFGAWGLPLLLMASVIGCWTYGRAWNRGKDPPPNTTLRLILEPPVFQGSSSTTKGVIDAQIALTNGGDQKDHDVYIRLQAPDFQTVAIDQPERVHLIGGNKGWMMNPTANLELLVPELLPHETRTIWVYLREDYQRSSKWIAYMRSDTYPNGREANASEDGITNTPSVFFVRFLETFGREFRSPTAPGSPRSCRACHL